MSESTQRRGLDGLTAEELAASRRAWWDDAFTDLLVQRLPAGAERLIDVGCGLATAAHALLPRLPGMAYVGIDADADRIAHARKLLAEVPWRDRVELRVGRAESLPLRDGEAPAALIGMTLMHVPEPRAVLREIGRVLQPGGRLLAIEPDQTGIEVYFDGVLDDLTAAYRELFRALRRHRLPADMAIGPALATLVERAALRVDEFFPHAAGKAKKMTAGEFLARHAEGARVIAAGLPPGAPEPASFRAVLAAREATMAAATTGYGCTIVPVFICAATKP
jgi:ubiquinone/menaquinone biosynthesis C-methylase UbiE